MDGGKGKIVEVAPVLTLVEFTSLLFHPNLVMQLHRNIVSQK